MHFKVFVVVDQDTDVNELLEQYYENGNLSFVEKNVPRRIEQEKMPVVKRTSLDAGQKRYLKSVPEYYQNLEWIPSYVFREYSSEHVLPASEVFVGKEGVRRFALDYFGYQERDGKYGCEMNPKALYDYYVLGGRWEHILPIREEGVKTTQELSEERGESTTLKQGKIYANVTKVKFIDWQFIQKKAEEELTVEHLDGASESKEDDKALSEQYKQDLIEVKIAQEFLPYIYINETGFIERDGRDGLGEEINENGLSGDEMDDFVKAELIKEENQDKLIYVFDFHI
jgi:hypothetical protein